MSQGAARVTTTEAASRRSIEAFILTRDVRSSDGEQSHVRSRRLLRILDDYWYVLADEHYKHSYYSQSAALIVSITGSDGVGYLHVRVQIQRVGREDKVGSD